MVITPAVTVDLDDRKNPVSFLRELVGAAADGGRVDSPGDSICVGRSVASPAMQSHHELASDYPAARARFLAAAEGTGAVVRSHPFLDRGPTGEELAVDVARQGPADADRVVLVVSGTHGVEGFAGSLCQSRWLEEQGSTPLDDGLAIVWVHAHNPYGFAWVRRVNEDNVDINRNYTDFTSPPANDGYDELAAALAPSELTPDALGAADAVLVDYAGRHGIDELQAAVSGGQYRHPDGFFYGGRGPARSQAVMRKIIEHHLAAATRVAILDLHTGLGPWGEVELISHEVPGTPGYDRAVAWWGERVASNASGDSVSASLDGEWMVAAEQWLAPREVTPIALEWGTVDSISVLQALRADNWLHHHGDPTGTEAAPIKTQLRAAFAPDDPAWADAVHRCFAGVLTQTVAALS
ncbi:MAG: DUF2817 domain-containing protein [Acidimicrobiia bacterium]|nr:DUF2817 domain-containing protein [Acidimicrobiia bacterium]